MHLHDRKTVLKRNCSLEEIRCPAVFGQQRFFINLLQIEGLESAAVSTHLLINDLKLKFC